VVTHIVVVVAKRKGFQVPENYWRGGKVPWGDEYHHYPSLRAQRLFHYLLSMGRSVVPRSDPKGHEHEDRFLFHYIRRGELWHTLRGKTHRPPPGSVVLMDLRAPVRYGNDRAKPSHVWWVCFGGKDIADLYLELAADQNPIFEKLDSKRLETLFLELLQLTQRKPAGYEPRASVLIGALLAELFVSRESEPDLDIDLVNPPSHSRRFSQPVRNALRCIARYYETALDLKTLSAKAGLNLYHFSRIFQGEVGMPPIHYLNHYRTEKAKQVLASSDQPIQEIGKMVGISNPFKFSHLFHKITGVTPSQYRHRASQAEPLR
jgi:AraC family transcriptional regulator of arabinose operon